MPNSSLPPELSINAWTGDLTDSTSPVGPDAKSWGTAKPRRQFVPLAATAVDLSDYKHDEVGWGLLLPDDDSKSAQEKAGPVGALPAIQALWESRPGSPVLRYRPDGKFGFLRRYYEDGRKRDLSLLGARGLGDLKIPLYLLIAASPKEIPWELQFFLNGCSYVGRLDLEEDGLNRYVDALMNEWDDSQASMERPVAWAVDHGPDDITWLMRQTIVEPIVKKLTADPQIAPGLRYLKGANATGAELITELATQRPGLILTSSHGNTRPASNPPLMSQQLGLLIDVNLDLLSPADLLASWQPDGAIWLAQACCSAGGAGENRYKNLLKPGSTVDETLDAVAGLGAMVAPMPQALLGAEKPLRAFVGQVDPTFNWTLRSLVGQVTTDSLVKAVSPNFHLATPLSVGLSFERYFNEVGDLLGIWERHRNDADNLVLGARTAAVEARLTSQDRESLVVLGDPTVVPVALPPVGLPPGGLLPADPGPAAPAGGAPE